MRYVVNDFHGMIPKTSSRNLPHGAATQATNCTVVHGSIHPQLVPEGDMQSGANQDAPGAPFEQPEPPLPPAVTLSPAINVEEFVINADMTYAVHYQRLVNNNWSNKWKWNIDNIDPEEDGFYAGVPLTFVRFTANERGGVITYSAPPNDITINPINYKEPYSTYGPFFRFEVTDELGSPGGTPSNPNWFPVNLTATSSPRFPGGLFPVTYNYKPYDGAVALPMRYGYIQIIDYIGRDFRYDDKAPFKFVLVLEGDTTLDFVINMNYTVRQNRTVSYATTTTVTFDGVEYESGLSEPVSVMIPPGQECKIDFVGGDDSKKVYRSSNYGPFYDITPINAHNSPTEISLYDTIPLTPLGQAPETHTPLNHAPNDGNFVLSPAGYGISYNPNQLPTPNVIYYSEYEKPFNFPPDQTISYPGETIYHINTTSNGVMVYTDKRVEHISGHPKRIRRFLVTDTVPAVGDKAIIKMNGTHFWWSVEGLVASNGNYPQAISEGTFTREQVETPIQTIEGTDAYPLLTGSDTELKSYDRSIFAINPTENVHLRIDTAEGVNSLTIQDLDLEIASPGVSRYISGEIRVPTNTVFSYLSLRANGYDANSKVFIYIDGELINSGFLIANEKPVRLGVRHTFETFQYVIESAYDVTGFILGTSIEDLK